MIYQRILILAPHTDDGEFGCGATVSKMVRSGATVHYVAFSGAEESVPPGLPRDILRTEAEKATGTLGVSSVRILHYPVRRFPEFRQQILEDMVSLKRELEPDLVFCPSPNDIHQDHQVIASEAIRAYKDRTILGYEMPWNNLTITTTCFIELAEEDLLQKIKALQCYMSQNFRNYVSPEFVRSLARVRGTQVGVTYAEVFEVVRWIMR